jgi:DNA-binding protein H-NS
VRFASSSSNMQTIQETTMNERTLEIMPINMLWALRERIDATLASKLISEKQELERRLARLTVAQQKIRRPYPQVHPKYFNPENPSQTWSGRGLKPRWFAAQLEAGRNVRELVLHDRSIAA